MLPTLTTGDALLLTNNRVYCKPIINYDWSKFSHIIFVITGCTISDIACRNKHQGLYVMSQMTNVHHLHNDEVSLRYKTSSLTL